MSRLRPMPRMRVAPMPSACKVRAGAERAGDAVDGDCAAGADAACSERAERRAEIAEPRRGIEAHRLRQHDQALARRHHVFGEAAVRIGAQQWRRLVGKTEITLERGGAALQRRAGAAIDAGPAIEPRIDVNARPDRYVGHGAADLRDHARRIEPDARRQRRQPVPQRAAEDRVHVGDDAASFHRDQHVARTRLRHGDAIDAQWLAGIMQTRRAHSSSHASQLSGYSALIPAKRITLPHFSVSSARSFAKSAGEPDKSDAPSSASRFFLSGSARMALTSRLSLSTTSAGVPFGPTMPYQALAS